MSAVEEEIADQAEQLRNRLRAAVAVGLQEAARKPLCPQMWRGDQWVRIADAQRFAREAAYTAALEVLWAAVPEDGEKP